MVNFTLCVFYHNGEGRNTERSIPVELTFLAAEGYPPGQDSCSLLSPRSTPYTWPALSVWTINVSEFVSPGQITITVH